MSTGVKISLAIITLNEERNIERCIRSVPFADDIVVLDSGSTDRTLEIARKLGARVSTGPWRGYAKQKTRAAALGQYQWILSLDADEALSEEAQKELKELLEKGSLEKQPTVSPEKLGILAGGLCMEVAILIGKLGCTIKKNAVGQIQKFTNTLRPPPRES